MCSREIVSRVLHKYADSKFDEIVQAIGDGDIRAMASFPILGMGDEATVFDFSSQSWVLKMSNPRNIGIEYEIFSDPTYSHITPEVREKDEKNGKWMVVERVTPLGSGNWELLMEHFPSLTRDDDDMEWGRWWKWDNTLRAFEEAYPSFPPESDIYADEDSGWIYSCVSLHKERGFSVYDVKPGNLGIDHDGKLVLFDVFTG